VPERDAGGADPDDLTRASRGAEADADAAKSGGRRGGPLWFIREPDELLRRFIWRTVLQPPRASRIGRPRGPVR
jgi:hypothetical protein